MSTLLNLSGDVTLEGRVLGPNEAPPSTGWRMVSPEYFKTMEIPLLQGRPFSAADDEHSPGVVIVDEGLARRLWPGESALNKRLKLNARIPAQSIWRTVVGVAGHVRQKGLAEAGGDQLYVPLAQYPIRLDTLVLDEPTIGMDVVVKEQVREFLRFQVQTRGRTVVLTTHDMTEVHKLAGRVVLINHGHLVFDGPLDELRQEFGNTWQLTVTLADAVGVPDVPGLTMLRHEGPRVVFGPGTGDGAAGSAHEALRRIIERYPITDLAIEESDLEDVMRKAYLTKQAAPA